MNLKALVSIVAGLLLPGAYAQTFDLAADWSDSTNPNGVWTYSANGMVLASTTRVSDSWMNPQISWGDLPGIFRSNGTEQFTHDWLLGDIITHTGTTEVLWTSPLTGTISISGGVWEGRDIGRSNNWSLSINGIVFTGGLVASGDPYSRSSPFLFANGSGGATAVSDISVNAGDVIRLSLAPPGGSGDYVGITLSISATAIPEPSTVALVMGAFALFGARFCRKEKSRSG